MHHNPYENEDKKEFKKETYKLFIYQIKNVTKGIRRLSFLCSFTRGYESSKEKFVFPNMKDIYEIFEKNVSKKLNIVQENRGKYIFDTILL